MKQTTAGKIADRLTKYVGKTVTFPDFHGRTITGTLDGATALTTAAYATLKVDGRERSVFRNTPVKVA